MSSLLEGRRESGRIAAALMFSIRLLSASPAAAQIITSCVPAGGGITTCTASGTGGSGLAIPAGVTAMTFEVYGAQGGGQSGGLGGKAVGRAAVTPGALWWIEVGGRGALPMENGGGAGGAPLGGPGGGGPGVPIEGGGSQFGCGGGGRSTLRPCSSAAGCAPIIIAGGGGGMPWPTGAVQNAGGAGGENGQSGANGTQADGGVAGGGGGGTASAPGAGGAAPTPDGSRTCPQTSEAGWPGDEFTPTPILGFGGVGGFGCWGGGGGGAGLHGGGGGGAGGSLPGGGGGGGSSYVDATLSDRSFATGAQSGNGKIVYSYLDPNAPTTTTSTTIPAATNVPLGGSRIRLADSPHPEGRRNLVALSDAAVDLSGVDPRVTGATVEIGQAGGTATVLDFPPNGWTRTGNAPRIDFKYRSSAGPVRAARLIDGRSIRFSANGADAYALAGLEQTAVSIVVGIGDVRFCGLFGGSIKRDDGQVFLARRASPPSQCPAP